MQISDEILLDLMKKGDSASFNILFDRYWEKLYATVFSVCSDREVCSEVVHDIFLNLWIKREKLQIESFRAYIHASARYHVYRHVKNARRQSLEYREDLEFSSRVSMNDGELNIHYRDLEKSVERELQELPRRCQEIFTLSRREQLSNDEIAARLDISKRSVENQLTHALRHLRLSMRHFLVILYTILSFNPFS
ncbi:RNA polymerase sigma-70 factor, ECF subfamily [Daejeonella rubra]|uniref:RNA polymerase sigma-70 factor, ECF subfamily n=1 Tax=Daejeonella rubra TaxID=990371 RepID=A0A1G9TTF4_9SPHI|nr:sigma-70 family RNA polymerase sigma factor [Daejeonella rubra]SDM50851.1 RNA polymerase sigma-70 factor, ECF subfamily [Daejeonella rubra]